MPNHHKIANKLVLLVFLYSSCNKSSSHFSSPNELVGKHFSYGEARVVVGDEIVANIDNSVSGELDVNRSYSASATSFSERFDLGIKLTVSLGNLPLENGIYTLGELKGSITFQGVSLSEVMTVKLLGIGLNKGNILNSEVKVTIIYLSNGIRLEFSSPTSILDLGPPVSGFIEITL